MKKMVMLGLALLAALAVALVGATPALAATAVHCPPTGGDDLQTVMNNAAPGAQILIYGTCTGNFTVTKNLTLVGETGVLDGNNSGVVLTVNTGVTVVVDYLTIQHGNAVKGAGAYNSGTMTLNGSTVSGNSASAGGGGIYNNINGTVTLNNSIVSGNKADSGGGVASNGSTLTMNNSKVSGNTAGASGGGILDNGSTVTFKSSTVSQNYAGTSGGGVFNNGGSETFTNSSVTGNGAGESGGGFFINAGSVTLRNSVVSGNWAGGSGGGIFNNGGTVALTNSPVSGNHDCGC